MARTLEIRPAGVRAHLAMWLVAWPLLTAAAPLDAATEPRQGKAKAAAKGKVTFTYPQPPKLRPTDPLTTNPAMAVPEFPERYTFKITTKIGGKDVAPGGAPIYGRTPKPIGNLAEGTEIKITQFRRAGDLIFYAVPSGKDGKETAWVSGIYVKAAAYRAP